MRALLKNLGKHSIIYGFGDLLAKSIGFLLIPIYTSYLAPSAYGTLELLELSTYIVSMFLTMGVSEAIVRFYDEDGPEKTISVALGAVAFSTTVALFLLVPFSGNISQFIFQTTEYSALFKIVFVTMAVNLLADVGITVFRIQERSILVTFLNLVRLVLSLSLNILFLVRFEMGIKGVVLGGLIAGLVMSFISTSILTRGWRFQWDWNQFKKMVKYGAPLIGSWMGMFVLNFADRFMLQRLASLEEVGVYSLAYRFGMLPNMLVVTPFMMIWWPKRFELANRGESSETFGRVYTYFLFFSVLIATGIAVMIEPVLQVVTSPERPDYLKAALYVGPILLAYVFYGSYLYAQFGIMWAKRTMWLGIISLGCGLLNVLLNLWTIPRWGAMGASWSTVICFMTLLIIAGPVAQKYYSIPYELKRVLLVIGAGTVAYFSSMQISVVNPIAEGLLRGSAVVFIIAAILLGFGFLSQAEIKVIKEVVQKRKLGS